MKFHRLAKKGDIFAQEKPAKKLALPRMHYKPLKLLQATGIVTFAALFLVGAGTLIAGGQTTLKQLAEPIPAVATTESETTDHRNNDNWNDDNYRDDYWYTNTPLPDYRYANNNPTPNTANIGASSQQIVATQQQMAQVMQNCHNSARQMQAQIINMRRQEEQMNRQIDAIWDRAWKIDTSRPEGERQRQAIENQARQMERARENLQNNIGRAEEQFNANRDRCWQAVDALNERRETLEGRLHEQFGQGMDLPLWIDR